MDYVIFLENKKILPFDSVSADFQLDISSI